MPYYPAATAIHRSVTAPDGWRDTWDAAKATAGTTPAWCTFIGDSNPIGYGGTSWNTKGIPEMLKAYWNTTQGYPWYADYWPVAYSADFHIQYGVPMPGGTLPWNIVVSGTVPHIYQVFGLQRCYYALAAITATTAATFTSPTNTTAMDLLYTNWFAGTWTYSDAGGTRRTVTDTGTLKTQRATVGLTGLTNASHTLRLDGMTMNGPFPISFINGVVTYTGATTGLGLGRVIAVGGALSDFTQASIPVDSCLQFAGSAAGSVAAGVTVPFGGALVIIWLGVNDVQAQRPVQSTAKTLDRICAAARRGYPQCSIVVVNAYNPDPAASDQTAGWGDAQNWQLYTDAFRGVAAFYRACVVDVHNLFGQNAFAQGLVHTNADPHISDAGSALIFDLLTSPAVGI